MNSQIIKEVKKSKFFSIVADEVSDCSSKEQMPLVLRYVSERGEIIERFIKFIHCDEGIRGKALSRKIIHCVVNELGLDLRDCRGQCYDGASNMSGKYSGVAAHILEENRLALYTHCASHRLNLCVASACQIQVVTNMMQNVTKIGNFFHTPKRKALLQKMVKQHLPVNHHTTLLDVCRTRWIQRIDGLERFLEMYVAIAAAFEIMVENIDNEWACSASDAFTLQSIVQNFIFLITLVIVRHCLAYTTNATYQLQGAQIDILGGLQEIRCLMQSLQNARDCIDIYHSCWYKEACHLAAKVDCTVKHPRFCERQRHRGNNPASNTSDYFKVNVSVPFLDHLLQELSERFSERNSVVIRGLSIIPKCLRMQYVSIPIGEKRKYPLCVSDSVQKRKRYAVPQNVSTKDDFCDDQLHIHRLDKEWKRDVKNLCQQYLGDLPNPTSISHEIDNWESLWSSCSVEELPSSISETLKKANQKSFPNITILLRILGVMPFTSCTCER